MPIVCHIEPIFGPNYCSPELRLGHVYMLPIEPVVFEWPDPVTSAATSATTTPINLNTPNKKPKIELLTDSSLESDILIPKPRLSLHKHRAVTARRSARHGPH